MSVVDSRGADNAHTGLDSGAPLLDVLVVDDDHSDLALVGLAIRGARLNIWLQTATSAEQAIAYLEGKGTYSDRSLHPMPDVIVLDLVMPGMGGLGFLAWRKRSPVFSRLAVLALSGFNDEKQAQEALALGASGYLSKPEDFDGWATIVQTIWNAGVKHAR